MDIRKSPAVQGFSERVKKVFLTRSNGKRVAGFPFEKGCILLRA